MVAEGMEADKVSFVLSSLMKAGADGRKALKKGFDEKSAATLAATGKETTERPSDEDAAYYQKVEQMGVLGMSLRGKDGKALFKPVASVREVKGTDGTSKLERAGVDMTTILEEAAADFIITHRLSQIRWADLIIVLKKGKIAAIGTHEDLMKTSDAYSKIFRE